MGKTTRFHDTLAASILDMGCLIASADRGLLYLFDIGEKLDLICSHNVQDRQVDRYHSERLDRVDPLSVSNLSSIDGSFVAIKSRGRSLPEEQRVFYESFDIADEVNLIFRQWSVPIAGMSLIRSYRSGPFEHDRHDWIALQEKFRPIVHAHSAIGHRVANLNLINMFGLTRREVQTAKAIASGMDNQAIADLFGIKISTIKTHIVNIFDKTGIGSRSALCSLLQSLPFEFGSA